jgi:hypothetical protein
VVSGSPAFRLSSCSRSSGARPGWQSWIDERLYEPRSTNSGVGGSSPFSQAANAVHNLPCLTLAQAQGGWASSVKRQFDTHPRRIAMILSVRLGANQNRTARLAAAGRLMDVLGHTIAATAMHLRDRTWTMLGGGTAAHVALPHFYYRHCSPAARTPFANILQLPICQCRSWAHRLRHRISQLTNKLEILPLPSATAPQSIQYSFPPLELDRQRQFLSTQHSPARSSSPSSASACPITR